MKRKHFLLLSALWLLTSGITSAIVDINDNGISDLFERQYNNDELFPETFDPQDDSDADGWTNAEEAAAGTNPFNPLAPEGIVRPEVAHFPAVMGEENGQPVVITPEAVTVTWPTIAGKQYTIRASVDLEEGTWLPVGEPFIATGAEVTYGFETGQSPKCFYRVAVTDTDTDGDTLTNAEEHELGTNPDSMDSDGDGRTDDEEVADGTDPSDSDTDNDNLADGIDADPNEPLVDWEMVSESNYLLLDVDAPAGQVPRAINDKEEVLFDHGISADGQWIPMQPNDPISGTYERESGDEGVNEYESTLEYWKAFNDNRQLAGISLCTTTFTPDPDSNLDGGQSINYSLLSWLQPQPQYLEEMTARMSGELRWPAEFSPLGIAADGKIASFVRYTEEVETSPGVIETVEQSRLVIFQPESDPPSIIAPADDFLLHTNSYPDAKVTPSGWITSQSRKTVQPNSALVHRVQLWDPDHTPVSLPSGLMDTYQYRLNLTELPNGRVGLNGVSGAAADGTVILQNANNAMEHCPGLSLHGIQFFAGNGTAITREQEVSRGGNLTEEHMLWRNGKLIPMGDLCDRYLELKEDGWQFHPLAANNKGVFLIQAEGPEGEQVVMKAVPVNLSIQSAGTATFLPEGDEEDPGAFTVANLNDQDGDGVIDRDDDSVKSQGGLGEDEEDLMYVKIEGPLNGSMKVAVTSGHVRFWTSSTKETEYAMENGAITIGADHLPKLLYVEATDKSESLMDIVMDLSHIGSNGVVYPDLDRVKATAVWAQHKSTRNTAGLGLWTQTHDKPFKGAFENEIGDWGINFNPPGNNPLRNFHYSIGFEFELFPPGIANESGVKFDFARDIAFREWTIAGSPRVVTQVHKPGEDAFDAADTADDDQGLGDDEDVTGIGDRVYVLDGPGHPLLLNIADEIVSRNNFNEWVRVKFDGFRPAGSNNFGSRCSDKFDWHSHYWVEWDTLNSRYKKKANATNSVGNEHLPLGETPSP